MKLKNMDTSLYRGLPAHLIQDMSRLMTSTAENGNVCIIADHDMDLLSFIAETANDLKQDKFYTLFLTNADIDAWRLDKPTKKQPPADKLLALTSAAIGRNLIVSIGLTVENSKHLLKVLNDCHECNAHIPAVLFLDRVTAATAMRSAIRLPELSGRLTSELSLERQSAEETIRILQRSLYHELRGTRLLTDHECSDLAIYLKGQPRAIEFVTRFLEYTTYIVDKKYWTFKNDTDQRDFVWGAIRDPWSLLTHACWAPGDIDDPKLVILFTSLHRSLSNLTKAYRELVTTEYRNLKSNDGRRILKTVALRDAECLNHIINMEPVTPLSYWVDKHQQVKGASYPVRTSGLTGEYGKVRQALLRSTLVANPNRHKDVLVMAVPYLTPFLRHYAVD